MRAAVLVGVLLSLVGCGGDGDGSDAGADREPGTQQTGDAPAAPREERPPAARSDRECLELWNSDAQPGTAGQKSPSDFVADIADKHRVTALARYAEGECIVVVPFAPGAKAGWAFVATGARAPFNHPSQIRLKRGQVFASNARTKPDGTLE